MHSSLKALLAACLASYLTVFVAITAAGTMEPQSDVFRTASSFADFVIDAALVTVIGTTVCLVMASPAVLLVALVKVRSVLLATCLGAGSGLLVGFLAWYWFLSTFSPHGRPNLAWLALSIVMGSVFAATAQAVRSYVARRQATDARVARSERGAA